MASCRACNSTLETIEYQTRSADEAHTTVVTCPRCPVDSSRISIAGPLRSSPIGMTRTVNIRSRFPRRVSAMQRCAYVLSIDVPSRHSLMEAPLNLQHLVRYMSIHRRIASDSRSTQETPAIAVISGMFQGECVKLEHREQIGMGIYIETYSVFQTSTPRSERCVLKGNYELWMTRRDMNYYLYCSYGHSTRQILTQLGYTRPSLQVLEDTVSAVYSEGTLPHDMTRYMGTDMISQLSNLSSRAWDTNAPPKIGYVFTCKPDGQRVWIVWIGHVWYLFKPRGATSINKWMWCNKCHDPDSVTVIDAEYMLAKGFIIIDFLRDARGSVSPILRDMRWVKQQYDIVAQMCPELPISIREYFDDFPSALRYCSHVGYPTDGVVAVRDGSTETLKIKSVKSMELRMDSSGYLVTAENVPVVKPPNYATAKKDAIVELRFCLCENTESIRILDAFERVDKDVPNSTSAVKNILRSCRSVSTPDDNERRAALLWCNDIRDAIVRSVEKVSSSANIIIDVGTGTGQSLDSILSSDSVSYVLVEPEYERCRMISRRAHLKHILASPQEIVPMIRGLKTGSVRAVILNCSFGDILDAESVADALLSEVKAIVCTFSMHYIVSDLRYVSARYRTPIYGCGYLYDGTDNKGVLVDSCGVLMRTLSEGKAEVRWGSDKRYEEPVTRRKDYAGIGKVLPGSEFVPLPDSISAPNANMICRNVSVLLP